MHAQTFNNTASIKQPYKRLPYQVLLAQDLAMHFQDLPRWCKDTFAQLFRMANKDKLDTPIWPSQSYIATEIRASVRTVQRHLAYLATNEYIEVLEQDRWQNNGRFKTSKIRLTQKSIDMIGIAEASLKNEKSSPDDTVAPRHIRTELTNTKIQCPRLTKGIPTPLAPLLDLDLSRAGLCKLMGMATAKGKRLEDIYIALQYKIKDKTGKYLFGFFRNYINDEKDYSYLATLKRQQILDNQRRKEELIANENARAKLKGKTYINIKKGLICRIDTIGKHLEIESRDDNGSGVLKDPCKILTQVEKGDLILATEDLLVKTREGISIAKEKKKAKIRDEFFKNTGRQRYQHYRENMTDNKSKNVNDAKLQTTIDPLLELAIAKANSDERRIKQMPIDRSENFKLISNILRNSSTRKIPSRHY